jgi:hypothetical protein
MLNIFSFFILTSSLIIVDISEKYMLIHFYMLMIYLLQKKLYTNKINIHEH